MKCEYIKAIFYGPRGLGSKEYIFHTFINLHVGDNIVVETQYGYATAMVIEIMDVLPLGTTFETREVLHVIDNSKIVELREQEEKKRRLLGKMQEVVKEIDEMILFELLAKDNQQMMDFLLEYKGLMEEV